MPRDFIHDLRLPCQVMFRVCLRVRIVLATLAADCSSFNNTAPPASQEPEMKNACYLLNSRHFQSWRLNLWWRFTDSNRGPVDYDSIALTD